MRLLACVAVAAAAFATTGVDAQGSISTDFRTCRRVTFSEIELGPFGTFDEDAFVEQFGMRVVVRNSPGTFSEGKPLGDNYNNHAKRQGAIFDTSRPTGGDIDLGSPNIMCDATCPAGFESCAICSGAGPLADPRVREIFLPPGHPGCGTAGSPDYLQCPGVGCGGGFWKMVETGARTISYPYRDEFGVVTNRNTRTGLCALDLDGDGCPIVNEAMNCRADSKKVIIVQENANSEPDDEARGGVISFIFDQPIELLGVNVLDMDDVNTDTGRFPGYIYGMASADESVNTAADYARVEPLLGSGDNSLDDVNVDYGTEIRRVVVWLEGSGSVNDVEYCAGRPPVVEVMTDATCTYRWSIDKTVNQEEWNLFAGQSTDEVFTTTVTRTEECELSPIQSSGTIEVGSPSGRNHRIVDVIGGFDLLSGTDPDTVTDPINTFTCSPFTPTPDRPFVLVSETAASVTIGSDVFVPGNTLTCAFDTTVEEAAFRADGTSFLKVEFVADVDGTFTGPSLTAFGVVSKPENPTILNEEATVTDDAVATFTTTETVTFTSTRSEPCNKGDSDAGTFEFDCTSTVTPVDSGETLTATAGTERTCYDLGVDKTATSTATLEFSWTIDKSASPATGDSLTVLELESDSDAATVAYQLTATHSSQIIDLQVSGSVTVTNPHPSDSISVDLTDVTFPSAEWDGEGCSSDGEGITVGSEGSVTCSYTVSLDAIPKDLVNEAQVTTQYGIDYSDSATYSIDVTETGTEAEIYDQFDGEDAVFQCAGSKAGGPSFTCFLNRMFTPGNCGDDADVETVEYSQGNAATVQDPAGAVWDTDSWLVNVITTCERCAECPADAPMYPMALDEDGVYRVTSAAGVKRVTLCWD